MATQHDQLMKELIASFPDQFMRLAAPRLAERIDLDAVAFEPEEHYPGSPTGRERRPDLVSRAYSLPGRKSAENGEIEAAVLRAVCLDTSRICCSSVSGCMGNSKMTKL